MNFTVNEITKSTGKVSLLQCDMDKLQHLLQQYPFFGFAKFLLTQKLKQENSPLLKEHIQKTSLYFQNPVWFEHVLNDPNVLQNYITAAKERPVLTVVTEMEVPATHEAIIDQNQTQQSADIVTGEEPEENKDLSEPLADFPKFKFEPIDPSKAELTFEPYHTVDYFASQGIQAKEEEKPKDQFSRQLKSFTEWLKVMKRFPVSEIAAAAPTVEEKKVEKMAETSINDRDVVTETMAEVWEKQGNVTKATEVYEKLSLLNPSKSSYFAAKIEQLKNL